MGINLTPIQIVKWRGHRYIVAKGCDNMLKASEARGCDVTVTRNQVIYAGCRADFTNKRIIHFHLKRRQCG